MITFRRDEIVETGRALEAIVTSNGTHSVNDSIESIKSNVVKIHLCGDIENDD